MTWVSHDTMIADRVAAAAARRSGQPGVESEVPALLAKLDVVYDAAFTRGRKLMPLGDLRLRQVLYNVKDLANHAHPARAAHLLREAIAVCEAYAEAPDLVIRNSFMTSPTGGVDVRRAVEAYRNPPPPPAPVPFNVVTWARARLAEGWAFRVDHVTGAVMARPPAPPHHAARPDQIESARIILRDHSSALADALATAERDEGFTVGAA